MTDPGLPFELGQVQLGNNAFEGSNNCYVLDGDCTTLVDTGIATPDTEADLHEGLDEYGLGFADVDQILLTHWHEDHVGLAGTIQAESGCVVRAHEADAGIIEGDAEAEAESRDTLERLVDEWGMPDGPREELLTFLDVSEANAGDPPDVTPFTGGETFEAGDGVALDAVHLPGHSVGLTGFAFDGRDGREIFSGDALLPYYTPNVGGADTRVERPLADYLETLAGIVAAGYTRAWPGHRGAIVDPVGRAADIVVHHRERTDRIVEYLRESGPADPWTVSAHLFGDLSTIHILHGPGEAYAHLHHLAEAGVVERDGREYALVDGDADLDALFPDVADLALRPGAIPGPG
jgi:glyoxylase-like metal-dependent hydrolase (beta-lactamase superfamily II)